jgi:hypothetical protein
MQAQDGALSWSGPKAILRIGGGLAQMGPDSKESPREHFSSRVTYSGMPPQINATSMD